MQNWKESETSTIYLGNGGHVIATVKGISPEDGSGSAFVASREIKVAPLPDAWRALGYGEIVSVILQTGEVIEAILSPEEYGHHVASLSLNESDNPTLCLFDRDKGAWREMTEQEYEQERRAWSEDMADQQRIKDQWRAYRSDEPIPPDYSPEEIRHAHELQERGVTDISDLVGK